jgi:hypothetical protein
VTFIYHYFVPVLLIFNQLILYLGSIVVAWHRSGSGRWNDIHARYKFLHNRKVYVYIHYLRPLGWLIFVETHHHSFLSWWDSVHCVTEFFVYFCWLLQHYTIPQHKFWTCPKLNDRMCWKDSVGKDILQQWTLTAAHRAINNIRTYHS